MKVVQYEPWTALRRLHRDMDYLFQDRREGREHWVPAFDVIEFNDAFELVADIPGVDAQDLEITAENGELTVSGKRPALDHEQATRRRIERASGEFTRRFSLPDTADANAIEAKADKGVLIVRIPKKAQLQPRRIDVNVS